ncbi:MAG: NAD(+) synthase, partial [Lachnospiraceae bacterium]|nr:NAD(+) synthase [Lachnospiraceae bacterium]
MLVFVGLPLCHQGKLYNVAAALQDGQILGFVPKTNLPNYNEFYELRHFSPGSLKVDTYTLPDDYAELGFEGPEVPFGSGLLFECGEVPDLVVGAEICEDLWAPETPGTRLALAGATLIVNLSASNELVSKDEYRKDLVRMTSARLLCGYAYASAGAGESTQDLVFSGARLIYENGVLLAEGEPFQTGVTVSEIDVKRLAADRRRNSAFQPKGYDDFLTIPFHLVIRDTELIRELVPLPFIPQGENRLGMVLKLQSAGLAGRMSAIGCKKAVVGISGGLDSTLALIVAVLALDSLGIPRENILAITMPGFGTTGRTKGNAEKLAEGLGVTLRTIPIGEAVKVHFQDIGLSESDRGVAYENAQARERTQVLMDVANMENALVIGTGDLSELALGWATYNGDHMSNYGVNAGVPKTLIRHLVGYYAKGLSGELKDSGIFQETVPSEKSLSLAKVLLDILDTPVSPELLPPEEGEISQKTEDLVGPYELHDFFLYYMLRYGFSPRKIFRMAVYAFSGNGGSEPDPDEKTILHWLKVFYSRFFNAQFKRSCLPDGPKVGSIAVSPRGDWRMPSDAVKALWMEEIENLQGELEV